MKRLNVRALIIMFRELEEMASTVKKLTINVSKIHSMDLMSTLITHATVKRVLKVERVVMADVVATVAIQGNFLL